MAILKRGAIPSRRNHAIVIVEGAPEGDALSEEQEGDRPPLRTRRVQSDGRPQRDKSTNRNTKS